jgi:simple sugar transport system ATP-binding protein
MDSVSIDVSIAGAEALSASAHPAVELRGISKRFGSVVACDAIDFAIPRGRITGLLGENGAGKSTLMKILLGLVVPEAGEILRDGRPVTIRDPRDAAAMGLAMVHQHFSVIEQLTVWENVILGERGAIDASSAIARVTEVGERYGLSVDPTARVYDLSVGQRQRVEIIKCLILNPQVVILDEPTSVLTPPESRELFEVLRRVVEEEQRGVVLISHKLDEILTATDAVTILRRGQVIAHHASSQTTARELAREMVGREVSLRREGAALGLLEAVAVEGSNPPALLTAESSAGSDPQEGQVAAADRPPVVLAVRDATARAADGRPLLDGLTVEVRAGEIVGLAGVEGNGQVALQDLLSSLFALSRGTVEVRGRAVKTGRPGLMQRAGVGVIPEDRHRSGCVLDMSVAENLILADVDSQCQHGFLRRRAINAHALELIREYGIATPSPNAPFRSLSGGNQQRAVLARELSRKPAVLLAAHPTRGLDVGAMEYVTGCLQRVAESGVGVLLISSDLEEILFLSHRIAVIHRGRIIGEMLRSDLDIERLGMMMGGQAA